MEDDYKTKLEALKEDARRWIYKVRHENAALLEELGFARWQGLSDPEEIEELLSACDPREIESIPEYQEKVELFCATFTHYCLQEMDNTEDPDFRAYLFYLMGCAYGLVENNTLVQETHFDLFMHFFHSEKMRVARRQRTTDALQEFIEKVQAAALKLHTKDPRKWDNPHKITTELMYSKEFNSYFAARATSQQTVYNWIKEVIPSKTRK